MEANTAAQQAWDMRINLFRVALSILNHNADAEDAVSTAMIRAFHKAGSISSDEKFNAWLMRILVRCCYDIIKQRKREIPTDNNQTFDGPIIEHTDGTIWEYIRELPLSHQKVLVLFYYEGFKAHEIARILSLPLGTVLVHLSRGRSKLKECILKERGIDMEGVTHVAEQTV